MTIAMHPFAAGIYVRIGSQSKLLVKTSTAVDRHNNAHMGVRRHRDTQLGDNDTHVTVYKKKNVTQCGLIGSQQVRKQLTSMLKHLLFVLGRFLCALHRFRASGCLHCSAPKHLSFDAVGHDWQCQGRCRLENSLMECSVGEKR